MDKERKDQQVKRYRAKCRYIMLRLAAADRRKAGTCVSFEDLGVPFQDYHVMDLREKRLVALSLDNSGKPGALLRSEYSGMTLSEFNDVLNREIGKSY